MSQQIGWYYFPVKELKKEHLKFLLKSKLLKDHTDLREIILAVPRKATTNEVFNFWHESFLEDTDIKLNSTDVEEIITLMAVNKELAYAYIKKYQTN